MLAVDSLQSLLHDSLEVEGTRFLALREFFEGLKLLLEYGNSSVEDENG